MYKVNVNHFEEHGHYAKEWSKNFKNFAAADEYCRGIIKEIMRDCNDADWDETTKGYVVTHSPKMRMIIEITKVA